ncbi:MAG: ATP-binding protein, partial [Limisphaerales bacterium]
LKGALHSADLTRRLLAFARKQALEPRPFSINELLTDVSAIVLRTLPETIRVRVVLADELWLAYADPSQVQDAIINLAVNARDAMPDGGTLTIQTENSYLDEIYAQQNLGVKPGAYAMLGVSDTGTGMPPEVVERVFEPFFTTKPAGQGTGLGLAMIYGFARQSGGHVKVYSEVGHGTSVKLYLPRAMEGAATMATESPDESSLPRGAETVLVAEDNEALRHMAVEQLVSLGYRVLDAESGEAALAIVLGGGHVDLLFSDVVMGGRLTGIDLAHESRKNRPGLRVLLTTGYADPALLTRISSVGTFLRKPYRKRDLALKLRSILDEG